MICKSMNGKGQVDSCFFMACRNNQNLFKYTKVIKYNRHIYSYIKIEYGDQVS